MAPSEDNQKNFRQIQLLTDANINLRLMNDLDLTKTRKFQHTPKDGSQPPEDCDYYASHYKQNKFIREFMNGVDKRMKNWSLKETSKV